MNKTQIKFAEPRVIEDLGECFFYHTMTLPTFGEVHAHWDLRGRFDDYIGGVDLKGKSVIDIGTATGFLSFEAEQRGATRVVSFDMEHARLQAFLPFKDKQSYIDPEGWSQYHNIEVEHWKNAYWLCHRLLGSKAQVYYGDINVLPAELGTFDVAIIGSVLEHLSDPVRALSSVSRLVGETIVVVTPLVESDDRFANFEGRATNPEQDFTWWTLSRGLYREVFAMLGFEIVEIKRGEYFYDYGQRNEIRYTIVAERKMSDRA
jgi:SAM-dependent methyltransferase